MHQRTERRCRAIWGVITTRARALRIGSKLPANLWPEMVKCAAYLLNRPPCKYLQWKTPLEAHKTARGIANPEIPNVAHLRAYGCRAYVHIPTEKIQRTDKLAPRAHISYLIGYESTNIFRVWISRLNKVLSSRDVIFDESRLYNPNEDTDDLHLYEREVIEVIELPEQLHPSVGSIEQVGSDEDISKNEDTSHRQMPTMQDDQSDISEEIVVGGTSGNSGTPIEDTPSSSGSDSAQGGLPTPDPTRDFERWSQD
jgi:hypothetical protein